MEKLSRQRAQPVQRSEAVCLARGRSREEADVGQSEWLEVKVIASEVREVRAGRGDLCRA